jgi:hypothetical protein
MSAARIGFVVKTFPKLSERCHHDGHKAIRFPGLTDNLKEGETHCETQNLSLAGLLSSR